MMRLAILDDYQKAAIATADWDSLRPGVEIQTFHDTLASEDAAAETPGRLPPHGQPMAILYNNVTYYIDRV
jgi:hypothetical protein